jgi:sulfur-oxidizing protein SoxY
MTSNRRQFMQTTGLLASYWGLSATGVFGITKAYAKWDTQKFGPSTMEQTMKQVLKGKPIASSNKIQVKLPTSADNRTPVPIIISTSIKASQSIAIIVERNPVPLVAMFELSPLLEPFIATRLKLAHSSFVFVLVETPKVFYGVKQTITVSDIGCEA